MAKCTVYIDESGDLGYRRGTTWFVLTALIVNEEQEKSIRKTVQKIKQRLNYSNIHFSQIREFNKKAYVVQELAQEQFVYINVLIDTKKSSLAMKGSGLVAYNYACRLLLERVSWFLRDTGNTADVILSARGTSRDNELIDYIKNKLLPYDDNQIVSNVIGKVYAMPAPSRDLLQVVDVCASTTFMAYNINDFGFRTPCFFKVLFDHVYKRNGKVYGYGLKYFSNEMKPKDEDLKQNYICMKKERTPGATTT